MIRKCGHTAQHCLPVTNLNFQESTSGSCLCVLLASRGQNHTSPLYQRPHILCCTFSTPRSSFPTTMKFNLQQQQPIPSSPPAAGTIRSAVSAGEVMRNLCRIRVWEEEKDEQWTVRRTLLSVMFLLWLLVKLWKPVWAGKMQTLYFGSMDVISRRFSLHHLVSHFLGHGNLNAFKRRISNPLQQQWRRRESPHCSYWALKHFGHHTVLNTGAFS